MRSRPVLVWLALSLLVAVPLSAQSAAKRALTHDDYDGWESLRGQAVSYDGRWLAATVAPQVGDGELVVSNTEDGTVYRYARGSGARFTPDSRFVVFTIAVARKDKLAYDIGKLEKSFGGGSGGRRGGGPGGAEEGGDDKRNSERARPGLGIMSLEDGKVEVVERVKGFRIPDEAGAFVAYHMEKPKKEKKDKDAKGKKAEEGKKPKKGEEAERGSQAERTEEEAKEEKGGEKEGAKKGRRGRRGGKPKEKTPDYWAEGTTLVVRDLDAGDRIDVEGVTSYGVISKRDILWFVCNSKEKETKVQRGLFARDLVSGHRTTLVEGGARYQGFTTDRNQKRFAFVSNRRDRDAKKNKSTYDIYVWDFKADSAEKVVSHVGTRGFPEGRCVSAGGGGGGGGRRIPARFRGRFRGRFGGGGLSFSEDAGVLMFAAAELPKPDLPKLLDEEKVTLDLWHWKDPLLQPMQAKQTRSPTLRCAWHFDAASLTVLTDNEVETASFLTRDGSRALVQDSAPYQSMVSWDGRYSDVYAVNTLNGERRLLVKKLRGRASSSPTGSHVLFFRDHHWFSVDVASGKTCGLTTDLAPDFAVEDWDTPQEARAYGTAGWTENGSHVLIYDRFDIWALAPDGSEATCVTDGFGRASSISLRYTSLDPEERYIKPGKKFLLSASNTETMATGYYTDQLGDLDKPRKVVMVDKRMQGLRKAKDADRLFFTMSTFADAPNVWTSGPDFSDRKKLTSLNPQQKDIRWGNAELVRWHSADGTPLKGFLVKPEGFDPKKKYPMMVYFYEKTSSSLHRYVSPAPGTSPNAAYYVSNGYLWFQPDIVYRDGYPGESCVKCVVSGIQHLLGKGFVKRDAIGAAGHSWGGYQTAYLVTRSNIFKAVESGAPVSNMTSAYGGIRWGSGMSRAFQYERTQSRIGGSLWDYPLRYLENSPLFHADKVETPVLMLHNDEDGAVPWYQGIEYFCALRRLGKEVYMFNYVGDGHGIRRRPSQQDWTRRVQQYFDHHLRGHPMPEWMANGVAYRDRDREKLSFNPPNHPVYEKPKTETPIEASANGNGNGG